MKKTINFYDFQRGFEFHDREHQFSRSGLRTLFDYFEEYEEDCDTEIEFDPIAICCEYVEYDNIAEFHLDYDHEDYPDIDAIEYHTQVIMIDKESFIMQSF